MSWDKPPSFQAVTARLKAENHQKFMKTKGKLERGQCFAVQVNASEDRLEAGIGTQWVGHGLHRHITLAVVVLRDSSSRYRKALLKSRSRGISERYIERELTLVGQRLKLGEDAECT